MNDSDRTMLALATPDPAPGRCASRGRRVAQLRFVALPPEQLPADGPSESAPPARWSIFRRLFEPLS